MNNPDVVRARGSSPRLVGMIFIVAAVGFGALTVIVERHQRKVFEGALHTTGTVVAMLARHGTRGSVTYAPLVRYRTNTDVQIDFTSSTASNPPSYTVGQSVPVVYSPLNPQEAEIDSWLSRWLRTALFGGVAVVFLSLGSVMIFTSRAA